MADPQAISPLESGRHSPDSIDVTIEDPTSCTNSRPVRINQRVAVDDEMSEFARNEGQPSGRLIGIDQKFLPLDSNWPL